jgi:hypothetical protein
MSVILRSLVLFALIACVVGHSVLSTPTPINANPTKTAPCGVATMPAKPVAAAQWAVGTAQQIAWKLVATDGGNALSAVLDTTGAGTTAAFTAGKSIFSAQAFGTAGVGVPTTIKFTVPAGTTCAASPNGLCVLRMVSNTNWNSCIYVNVTQVVEPAAPVPPPTCAVATGLTYCTMLNGKYVSIKAGTTAAGLDSEVQQAFANAVNDTDVFSIGGLSAACDVDYKDYLCKTNIPPCGADADLAACTSDCQKMTKECGLTTLHAALYPCTGFPACGASASDPAASASFARASAVIAAGALGVAAFL